MLAAVNTTTEERAPSVSSDGLRLYLTRLNGSSLDLYVDELQLRRLKKRKLLLKDQILRLESELIPDLNA